MNDLLTPEQLECMPDNKGLSVEEWSAVRRHIAALEKGRDEWFKRAMVAETLRDLHREERDAALADNAALLSALRYARTWAPDGGATEAAVAEALARKNPGAALLEEHKTARSLLAGALLMLAPRKGDAIPMVRARDWHSWVGSALAHLGADVPMELDDLPTLLEEHRKALAKEQAALSRALDTIRAAMGELGEACREGGLIGIMTGMERLRVRARNEGLEEAAKIAAANWDDGEGIAATIRAMKGPEE